MFQVRPEARAGQRYIGPAGEIDGQVSGPEIGAMGVDAETPMTREGPGRPHRCGAKAPVVVQHAGVCPGPSRSMDLHFSTVFFGLPPFQATRQG